MSEKKKVLGRGLSALLSNPDAPDQPAFTRPAAPVGQWGEIALEDIAVNPFQPRMQFREEELQELAASIKQLGVIQPITVRKNDDGSYQLISGERRMRASKLAGRKTIPAYIRVADDQAMLEMALVENVQRADLDAIEVAVSYNRLIEECNLTQEEMAVRVGKKRSTITNYLRLLKLSPLVQAGLRDQMLSMGHARALINLDNELEQVRLFRDIVSKDLSVRQVEEKVRLIKQGKPEKAEKAAFRGVDRELSDLFNTRVDLKINPQGKGSISLHFDDSEELDRLLTLLKS
jgi:ParB family chromosome partitioning protein